MSRAYGPLAQQPTIARVVRLGVPLLIAGLVCLCFWPVVGNEFVNWDDVQSFDENLNYRGLSLRHLRWMMPIVSPGS